MNIEGDRRVILHHDIEQAYPELIQSLSARLSSELPVVSIEEKFYPDHSPHLMIDGIPSGTGVVIVPGFISGKHAEHTLHALQDIGFTLGFTHPKDTRSPWAQHIHFLLSDCELRGDKPTTDKKTGQYVPQAELHFAYLVTQKLREIGYAGSLTILDPHSYEGVMAFERPVLVLSALPSIVKELEPHLPTSLEERKEKYGIVVADKGAIGRSLYLSFLTGIPIVAAIEKKRTNGTVSISKIHGKEQIKGKICLQPDDVYSTGGTMLFDGTAVKECGAKELYGMVTHVKGVKEGVRLMKKEMKKKKRVIDEFFLTNSTPYWEDFSNIPNVHVVDIHPLMALATQTLVHQTADLLYQLAPHAYPSWSPEESYAQLAKLYPDLV